MRQTLTLVAALVSSVYLACSPKPPSPASPITHAGPSGTVPASHAEVSSWTYVGSEACRPCHTATYERWKRTRMANVVRDPKVHPEAILPDLSKSDPRVTFGVGDIAFVYGSKWKQRYFTRVGDDYFPLPMQWDVTHAGWKPYLVANNTDWWVPFYGPSNSDRPTGPLCDGCHSVDYNVKTKAVVEWNVGCEKCHGPGSEHVKHPTKVNVFGPSKPDPVAANDACIQCHSQGRPLTNPVEGRMYDWPVGFRVGLDLKDFWRLEEHTLGETTFTHFADGTAHKNRMQGNDFVQSLMYARGVKCSNCHDVHGTDNPADLILPTTHVCGQCHEPGARNGPHAPTLVDHTHHRPDSPGSACISCHMPKIAQTIGDVMVRSHTFRFVPPSLTETSKVPNACTTCHADKPNSWARDALRSWKGTSPWRVDP
jgi:predicted CXXCH cytochrome family protein